jgi:hypothetical protein
MQIYPRGVLLIPASSWADGWTEKMKVMGAFTTKRARLKIKNQSCGDIEDDLKLKPKINPKMNA